MLVSEFLGCEFTALWLSEKGSFGAVGFICAKSFSTTHILVIVPVPTGGEK